MSLTESFMLPLGTNAPQFRLPNVVNGHLQDIRELKGVNGTLIIFMCNHCPYVIHLLDGIIKTSEKLLNKKINTIAISSNSIVTHPQDGPDEMKKLAILKKFSFPYLFDKTQEVAKSFKAECTPDFYLFDKKLITVLGEQLNILKNTCGIFSEFFFNTFKNILSKNLYFEFIVKLFTF